MANFIFFQDSLSCKIRNQSNDPFESYRSIQINFESFFGNETKCEYHANFKQINEIKFIFRMYVKNKLYPVYVGPYCV